VGYSGVRIEGLDEALASFRTLEVELRRNANGELRKASKEIAAAIPGMLGGGGSPQEAAVVAAARPKSDRYVVVAVPGVKPKLSGLRRESSADAKSIAYALEDGSSLPQFRGAARGGLVGRNIGRITDYAVPRYIAALEGIMRRAGLL
jgi:hypothetical protein